METAKQALERIKKEMGHEGKQTRNSAGYMKFRVKGMLFGKYPKEKEIICKGGTEEARRIFALLCQDADVTEISQMYIEENEMGAGVRVKMGKKTGIIYCYGEDRSMVRWDDQFYKDIDKVHTFGTHNQTSKLTLI